jgi:DNA-binding transcriptional regulator GbsR (MarR family)
MAATSAPRATTPAADAERQFVEAFALLLVESGMPRMPARVFAFVLADDAGGLTAGELAERLSVSAAAISGAVRWLTHTRLLTRAREPGARRDHYRVSDDQWYEVLLFKTAALQRWEEALADGVKLVGPERPAGRRLQETQEFFAFFREEMPAMMERWRASRSRA